MDTVSVVIACYDAGPFLGEAIDSALSQTYPAVEVVVVDDGSTDASWEVIRGYGGRIRALKLGRNHGAPYARNRGAELATGERLMFLDADDYLSADALEALVDAARRAPGAIAACPWEFLLHGKDGWRRLTPNRPFAPTGDPLRGWLEGLWAPPCAVLYPRVVFDAVGGFDELLKRNDDGDLAMRAFVGGARIVMAERGRAYYRRHGASRKSLSGDNASQAALGSRLRVIDKIAALLAEQGRLEPYRDAIEPQYGDVAMHAFVAGRRELGRAAMERGGEGARRRARSGTRVGRLLVRLVGLERKLRITGALRRWESRLRRAFV